MAHSSFSLSSSPSFGAAKGNDDVALGLGMGSPRLADAPAAGETTLAVGGADWKTRLDKQEEMEEVIVTCMIMVIVNLIITIIIIKIIIMEMVVVGEIIVLMIVIIIIVIMIVVEIRITFKFSHTPHLSSLVYFKIKYFFSQ